MITDHAAPRATQRAEAVTREPRHALARAAASALAGAAAAAGDLKRHDHVLAHGNAADVLSDCDDLGDALVTDALPARIALAIVLLASPNQRVITRRGSPSASRSRLRVDSA